MAPVRRGSGRRSSIPSPARGGRCPKGGWGAAFHTRRLVARHPHPRPNRRCRADLPELRATFPRVAGEGTDHSFFAQSRSTNFCTLPVEVLGSSRKTTVRGSL